MTFLQERLLASDRAQVRSYNAGHEAASRLQIRRR
jgi:hypothetical protein